MGFTKKSNWFCHLHKIDKKASGFKTTICSFLSQPQHSHVISDIFQCICVDLLCAHNYVGLSLQQYQFFCKSCPLLLLNQNSTQKRPQILKVFLSRWNYTVYQAKILIEMIEYLSRLESKVVVSISLGSQFVAAPWSSRDQVLIVPVCLICHSITFHPCLPFLSWTNRVPICEWYGVILYEPYYGSRYFYI